MRNRKKHMKLPNGFGSIKCLSGNRRKPYAVYPPVTEWTPTGPVTPPALAYTETWEEGYELLTAYNMEKAGKIKINRSVFIERTPTFAEVYQQFFDEKFHNSPKNFSKFHDCNRFPFYGILENQKCSCFFFHKFCWRKCSFDFFCKKQLTKPALCIKIRINS